MSDPPPTADPVGNSLPRLRGPTPRSIPRASRQHPVGLRLWRSMGRDSLRNHARRTSPADVSNGSHPAAVPRPRGQARVSVVLVAGEGRESERTCAGATLHLPRHAGPRSDGRPTGPRAPLRGLEPPGSPRRGGVTPISATAPPPPGFRAEWRGRHPAPLGAHPGGSGAELTLRAGDSNLEPAAPRADRPGARGARGRACSRS